MNGDGATRRDTLKLVGSAGATVGVSGLAGCRFFGGDGGDGGDGDSGSGETEPLEGETAAELAARFAPTIYFDAAERWFPTDPRPYTVERNGTTVVDGFAAFDGYHRRFHERGAPPDPTVFYRAVRYADSPLAVVQYWLYSAFDQFTTNFHWHDWELVQVFVDLDDREPVLFVGSAHSRKVPNNECLDPPIDRPRILPELGSHSSAVSVNDAADRFLRLPTDGQIADITNREIEAVERLAEIPAAYGLPRDEGARLPFLVPELDGRPIYEHPDLPHVERGDLVPPALTIRSFDALSSPPDDLPTRETGRVFAHADAAVEADQNYALVPTAETESIDDFTGPELSYEFAVPEFVEDTVASHITATGTPWNQPRYDDPVSDVTDPVHRETLADRYSPVASGGVGSRVVAGVTEAVTEEQAPDGEGVTTTALEASGFVLLQSEPVATPTFAGIAVLRDVAEGDHRLTVNVPGAAPYSERLRVGESGPATGTQTATGDGTDRDLTVAGADGEIPVVANEQAVKLRIDIGGTDADLRRVAVADDFGGRLYESRLDGPDAVYVHAGGAYTTEVRDADGVPGAFRVNPDPAAATPVTIDRPDTGTGSLLGFVGTVSGETRDRVAVAAGLDDDAVQSDTGSGDGPPEPGGDRPVRGLARALDAVAEAATRGATAAQTGNATAAERRAEAVATRLDRVTSAFENAADKLPAPIAAAVERRLDEMETRAQQARRVEKL
ncbi:MAG: hypothetical protein ABEH35_02495 [Haloarculaceae archaeon]